LGRLPRAELDPAGGAPSIATTGMQLVHAGLVLKGLHQAFALRHFKVAEILHGKLWHLYLPLAPGRAKLFYSIGPPAWVSAGHGPSLEPLRESSCPAEIFLAGHSQLAKHFLHTDQRLVLSASSSSTGHGRRSLNVHTEVGMLNSAGEIL